MEIFRALYLMINKQEEGKCVVPSTDTVRKLLEEVETDAARDAVKTSDEIADLIIFYADARANAEEMMAPLEYVISIFRQAKPHGS